MADAHGCLSVGFRWNFFCADLFYIPSVASTIQLQLTVSDGAVLLTPRNALVRIGVNNITLQWMSGGMMDLNFSVNAEDGVTSGTNYTIRIIQDSPPVGNVNWNATVSLPGGISLSLNETSPLDTVLYLPATAAYGMVTIDFVLASPFSYLIPSYSSPAILFIGPREEWTYFAWTVQAQDGLLGDNFKLSLYVAPLTGTNWTVTGSSNGLQPSSVVLSSETAEEVTTLRFPYAHNGINMSELTYWMSGDPSGTVTNSAGSPGTLLVPSDSAVPAARKEAAAWTGSDGHLYLYGKLLDIVPAWITS